MTSCSAGISSENTATGTFSLMETFSTMFIASDVLPMDGRPARISRSAGCRPLVILSNSIRPVGTPENEPSLATSSSMRLTALVSSELSPCGPSLPLRPCSAILKISCSATPNTSSADWPAGSKAVEVIVSPARMSWRMTERSRTISA